MQKLFSTALLIYVILASYSSNAQIISDTTHNKALKINGKPVPVPLFLKLDQSLKDSTIVNAPRKPITGLTLPGSRLLLNGQELKVYATGAFGLMTTLKPGLNIMHFQLIATDSTTLDTSIKLVYILPKPLSATKDFKIEEVRIYPSDDQELIGGDLLKVRVKALPGCKVTFLNDLPLYELPISQTGGIAGIYQANYLVKSSDTLKYNKLVFTLKGNDGRITSAKSQERIGFNDAGFPLVGATKGELPYMNFGLGSDRLGGAKLGYLDTLVRMKISGRVGELYRVDLTEHQRAWIPESKVTIMPTGTFFPSGTTGNISISGDSLYDYIRLNLPDRLPYSSDLLNLPTRIQVDVYGATSNTNWVIQHMNTKTINSVNTSQVEESLFRVTIDLNKVQSWGYSIYYEGRSQLVIRVKHTPETIDLQHVLIAIDPGHGGKNYGARGITGVYEKNFTLIMANQLKTVLEAAGAKVIMTRDADIDLSMYDRVKELRADRPDLLISIHANSTDNPDENGNSTYYRYIGYKSLSLDIFQKILELGLNDYGNVGRFNFALNGPTDYPNALVETAFLSNPSDEAHLLDPAFQILLAEKIRDGINVFLKSAGNKNSGAAGSGNKTKGR